jgi:hypothetical protein
MICDEASDSGEQSAASLRCDEDEAYFNVSCMDEETIAALTERSWFLLVRKQLRGDRDALHHISRRNPLHSPQGWLKPLTSGKKGPEKKPMSAIMAILTGILGTSQKTNCRPIQTMHRIANDRRSPKRCTGTEYTIRPRKEPPAKAVGT